MKKFALPVLMAITVSLMTIPAVWAGGEEQAMKLSEQCQKAQKNAANPGGADLCAQGDKLVEEGKYEEAIAKFEEGLQQIGGTQQR